MLDTLTQFNSRDFSARYAGTFGWLIKDDKGKHLVYISAVNSDRVEFTDLRGGKYHANAGTNVMFEFLPVDRGWFYGKSGDIYMLRRVPARQWHRGICDSNTNIAYLRAGRLRTGSCTIETLDDIFGQEKQEYKFEVGKSCVLSKHFAIIANALYFLDRQIGVADKETIILGKQGEVVKQELEDIISRNRYPLKVQTQ